jgi:2-desacetyl-2-hydroxyethyl bacteriochlorophyllide A dehydrogenase
MPLSSLACIGQRKDQDSIVLHVNRMHYASLMRALVYTAPNRLEMEERPRPAPDSGEVELAIDLAGVCGSDVSGFLGHSARRKPPLILGHELVGRMPDGRRVVANPLISCGRCHACLAGAQNLCTSWRLLGMDQTAGTFAEFVALPATQIYEVPDSLDGRRAILTEPLANVVHLFRLLAPAPFFRLAIVGGGTMGALALLTAQRIGAREVLVADVNDQRLSSLNQLGASHTVNTANAEGVGHAKELGGTGFDIVIDASGSGPARQMAFDLCRPGGQVLLLGMGQQRSEIDFVTSIRKEHRVVMSFAYTPADFERALNLLIAGEVQLDAYTQRFPIEEGQQAFEMITQRPGSTLKVVLALH